MSTIKVNTIQNTSGEGLYPLTVFIHFSMSGTIYNSESVSSLTDNGVGDQTVNYSVTLPNTGCPLAHGCAGKTNAVGGKTGDVITTTSARVYTGFFDNSGFFASDANFVQLHVTSK